jgi:hypothetical protein
MPVLLHRSQMKLLISVLLLCATPTRTEAQQPFVHGADILFRIRTDHRGYNIGDQIVIHYSIKNISNGALYVPRSQWEVKCGNPPHLWSRLEGSSGKHYEPGYAFSCLGPSPVDRMSVSERMQKDAVLLKPEQEVTGSFIFDSKTFTDRLKPGPHARILMFCGAQHLYSSTLKPVSFVDLLNWLRRTMQREQFPPAFVG